MTSKEYQELFNLAESLRSLEGTLQILFEKITNPASLAAIGQFYASSNLELAVNFVFHTFSLKKTEDYDSKKTIELVVLLLKNYPDNERHSKLLSITNSLDSSG